jgi:Ca-activated chloride channel homolog
MLVRVPVYFLLAACGLAQTGPTFQTSVTLVHVDTEVTDAEGRIVEGLTKADFRIFDDRKEQPILHFAATEQQLDLILLFDISGSMRPKIAEVAAAAEEGLRQLRDGDRVSVMVFNTRARVILPFTGDLREVEQTIRKDVLNLTFGGGTMIQSAVDEAALRFLREQRNERRRAVLIITDNIGQRTRREASVVRDFWEADAILSGLIVSNKAFQALRTVGIIMGPQTLIMQAGMRGIATKTGGDTIAAADPSAAFPEAMSRIRRRYSIYYGLPAAKIGSRRTVRVELSKEAEKRYPKARVRARTGYIVSEAGSVK